jgi:tRNA 2-selenouridine synthase
VGDAIQLPSHPRVIVLAGFTGTGKTALLARLAAHGEQTIDLEGFAHHRGSVFGATELPQPAHDDFCARVDAVYRSADPARVLWLEDTPRFIGSVGLSSAIQRAIENAPCVLVTADLDRRCTRLLATYGDTPIANLLAAVDRAAPRLGAERTSGVRAALMTGRMRDAARLLVAYYDAAYDRRLTKLGRRTIASVDADIGAKSLAS